MDPSSDIQATLEAAVQAVGAYALAPRPDDVDTVISLVTGACSRLEAFRLRMLRYAGIGDRSSLSASLGISRGEIAQLERTATRLAGLPVLQEALESGDVSTSKARIVAEALVPTRDQAGRADEAKLLEMATTLAPSALAKALDRWGREIDERAGKPTGERLRNARTLDFYRRHSGVTEMIARLDPESAELVQIAVDAKAKLEWQDEPAAEHRSRTHTQRRVDALVGICTDWLSGTGVNAPTESVCAANIPGRSSDGHFEPPSEPPSDPPGPHREFRSGRFTPPRSLPHLGVVIDLATLRDKTGLAVTERGAVLDAETARRIACDCGVSRILMNGPSGIIDCGREQRVVTGPLRKVLVLRDQGCRWRGCNAPPNRCQAHHVTHWTNGGATDTCNCALFCALHHHLLHEGGWQVTGNANATLTFTNPTGAQHSSEPPRSPLSVLTTARTSA